MRTLRPGDPLRIAEVPDLFARNDRADTYGPDAWTALGRTHSETRNVVEAMAAYRAAAILAPQNPAALCNATYGCRDTDREHEAIALLRYSLRLDPTLGEAWHNLASAFRNVGAFDLAGAAFEEALRLRDTPMSHVGLGELLIRVGAHDAGISHLEQAIAALPQHDPEWVDARFALGLALLSRGEFVPGWQEYNIRLLRPAFEVMAPKTIPEWCGPDDDHRDLLVWREQGIGDEVRFLSCLPDAIAATDSCTVRCSPRLASIITRSFGIPVVTGATEVPTSATCHAPIGRLPEYFRTSFTAFPGTPYLVADPSLVDAWHTRLAALGDRPKIGFSWRSRVHSNRRNQSYPDFESITSLADVTDVVFVDLQYNTDPDELRDLRAAGIALHHFDDLDLRDDIENVLALCVALDGVIAVGNTVAELAGAAGTPTALITPRHASMAFNRTQSAWHGSTTYVEKDWSESWTGVLERATHLLRKPLSPSKESS